jgi:hypothetical protein
MVDRERTQEAVQYLEEMDYLNPRVKNKRLTVGEGHNNTISIPLDHIEKIDTPDQEYVDWVKIHTENQMERLVNVMDVDRPEMGRRMFERFLSTGEITITFMPPDKKGTIITERAGIWSARYTAYKEE